MTQGNKPTITSDNRHLGILRSEWEAALGGQHSWHSGPGVTAADIRTGFYAVRIEASGETERKLCGDSARFAVAEGSGTFYWAKSPEAEEEAFFIKSGDQMDLPAGGTCRFINGECFPFKLILQTPA